MALAASLRWAALTGLNLALVGQGSTAEITAGLLTGLAAAAFSLLLRGASGRAELPRLGLARR